MPKELKSINLKKKQIMKSIIIFLFTIINCKLIYSQSCIGSNTSDLFPCCNQKINIDPLDNSFTTNTERLGKPNNKDIDFSNFDVKWMTPWAPFKSIDAAGVKKDLNNIIFSTSNMYEMISGWQNHYDIEKLPMHPKNGWQLMHHYDGWKPFTRTSGSPVTMSSLSASVKGFHYLFYNKYTGKARFIVYPDANLQYNPDELSLNWWLDKSNPTLHPASAIFNIYNSRLLALDKPTEVDKVKAYLGNGQNVSDISGAFLDFDLSYDPCVCVTKPLTNFELKQRSQMNLYAEGKYAGISRQFDISGKIPSGYGTDWLGSVYGDYISGGDFEVKNGFQVYRTAEEIARRLYVSPEMQLISRGLGLLGGVAGQIPALNIGTETLQNFWGSIQNVSGSASLAAIYNQVEKSKYKIPIGNFLGGQASYYSGQITSVSNISFQEGQITMRGKIVADNKWPGFDTRTFFQPGSMDAANNAPLGQYPYYNENVGLFAMLNTPKIWFNHRHFYDANISNHRLMTEFSINDPIKYTFNMASDVIIDKSKVFAMVEFDFYVHYIDTPTSNSKSNSILFNFDEAMENFFSPQKGFTVVKKDRVNLDSINNRLNKLGYPGIPNSGLSINPMTAWTYSSSPVKFGYFSQKYLTKYTIQTISKIPIDKIHNYLFKYEFNMNDLNEKFLFANSSNVYLNGPLFTGTSYEASTENTNGRKFKLLFDPRLKILGQYNFLPNRYETPPTLVQTLTYAYDYGTNISKPLVTNYIYPNVLYTSQINFTSTNNTVTADVIIVDSDLSGYSFPIILNGLTKVETVPSGVLSPTITAQIIQDPLGHVSLNPISETDLKTFCSTANYAAKNFAKSASNATPSKPKSDFLTNLTNLTLHPNPSTSLTTLTIENPSAEQASVRVYDLVGREVYSQDMRDVSESNNTLEISTNGWNTGIYIVKVIHGEVEKSIKLEVR